MDATILEYQPLTRSLDGKSELHISTYPAGFPRETSRVPFLYKALRTPESVYFQVFVRAVGKKSGPNPHIESIRIRSFSYQFPDQDPVELISDYDGYFWMQGNPKYEPGESSPVPCNENQYLQVRIDLEINGQDYLFEEQLQAAARRNTLPLLLYSLEKFGGIAAQRETDRLRHALAGRYRPACRARKEIDDSVTMLTPV